MPAATCGTPAGEPVPYHDVTDGARVARTLAREVRAAGRPLDREYAAALTDGARALVAWARHPRIRPPARGRATVAQLRAAADVCRAVARRCFEDDGLVLNVCARLLSLAADRRDAGAGVAQA